MGSYRAGDREDERGAEVRKAFREWLDASKAWAALRRTVEADGNSWTARRKLAELEERVEAAAEAFSQVQQRFNDMPLRVPTPGR